MEEEGDYWWAVREHMIRHQSNKEVVEFENYVISKTIFPIIIEGCRI